MVFISVFVFGFHHFSQSFRLYKQLENHYSCSRVGYYIHLCCYSCSRV